MPNADVNIAIGIKSTKRNFGERFSPTDIWNSDFHLDTDLDNYSTTVGEFTDTVFAFIQQERARGCEVNLHYAITITNVTHPTPAAGVIPMPKRHLDSALTDLELLSATVISEALTNTIADLRTAAKY